MTIDITTLLKKNKLRGSKTKFKNPLKVDAIITDELLSRYGDLEFIDTFMELAQEKRWTWRGHSIARNELVTEMTDRVLRIFTAEIDYYIKHGGFKAENWAITYISTGRVISMPTNFDYDGDEIWIDIDFSCSL